MITPENQVFVWVVTVGHEPQTNIQILDIFVTKT